MARHLRDCLRDTSRKKKCRKINKLQSFQEDELEVDLSSFYALFFVLVMGLIMLKSKKLMFFVKMLLTKIKTSAIFYLTTNDK
ncbi:MAG: hypothetical protein IJD40_05620 [Lachnospiraceae bacterium]|nr:hypothetical protein [Lachnospiraceae bacterium]